VIIPKILHYNIKIWYHIWYTSNMISFLFSVHIAISLIAILRFWLSSRFFLSHCQLINRLSMIRTPIMAMIPFEVYTIPLLPVDKIGAATRDKWITYETKVEYMGNSLVCYVDWQSDFYGFSYAAKSVECGSFGSSCIRLVRRKSQVFGLFGPT